MCIRDRISATLRQGLLLYEIKRSLFKPQRPYIGKPIPASVLEDWEGNPRGFLAWLRQHTLDLGTPNEKPVSYTHLDVYKRQDDEIDEVLGLRMGADDYVKKPFSQRLLVERIRALLRRNEAIVTGEVAVTEETKIMERGNLRMDPLRHSVSWKGQDVSLTVTEFMLLQALAQRPGFVKSRDQLMDVAYDDQVYVDDRTIDSHVKRLRKNVRAVDDDFSAIETLYGIGSVSYTHLDVYKRQRMNNPCHASSVTTRTSSRYTGSAPPNRSCTK